MTGGNFMGGSGTGDNQLYIPSGGDAEYLQHTLGTHEDLRDTDNLEDQLNKNSLLMQNEYYDEVPLSSSIMGG